MDWSTYTTIYTMLMEGFLPLQMKNRAQLIKWSKCRRDSCLHFFEVLGVISLPFLAKHTAVVVCVRNISLWCFLWTSRSVLQTGQQAPTVSTAVQAVLDQLWLLAVAVCHVSVMDTVTLSEATATTRQASAIAHITLRGLTVSPACLVTTETPGKEILPLEQKSNAFIWLSLVYSE